MSWHRGPGRGPRSGERGPLLRLGRLRPYGVGGLRSPGVAGWSGSVRFGVLGGDNAGFPNGRRLGDDVVDISLRVVGGFLKGNKLPLGDGVDGNDVSYLSTFPYVPSPHSGFDSSLKRGEPSHGPTPGDLNPPAP